VARTMTTTAPTLYDKTCGGCGVDFQSAARNTQYAPASICDCLAKRKIITAKQRARCAQQRAVYAVNAALLNAKSSSRATARRLVLRHFGVVVGVKAGKKTVLIDRARVGGLGCNAAGCQVTLAVFLRDELAARAANGIGDRGVLHAAVRRLLPELQAHHRNHDWADNTFESYPDQSNIELLCRAHHEQADHTYNAGSDT
jgi:hypothetical protein